MSPNITIIIPTYNRSVLISKTVNSIINQSFTQWECIIVDDHSTDDTMAVVNEIMERDSRISYCINERKKGAQGARNTGLYKAKTDWVIFFDSDNIMHPDMLCKLMSKSSDDIDVVTCWSNVIQLESGNNVGLFNWNASGNIHQDLLRGKTYVDTSSALIRTERCREIGGWSEDCPSFQEWDFHLRLSKIAVYTTICESLVDYYVGGGDTISKDKKREIRGYFYILRKYKKNWKDNSSSYRMYAERLWNNISNEKGKAHFFLYFFRLFPCFTIKICIKHVLFRIRDFLRNIWE